jgi:hypothetical protein
MKSRREKKIIAMIIYYFDFYFLLFLIYKSYYFNNLFSIQLVNEFEPDKLLNSISDPSNQNPVIKDSPGSYKKAGVRC